MAIELTLVPTETVIDPAADFFFLNDVSETPDAINKAVLNDMMASFLKQGTDVASAALVTLGQGSYFNITGTTTITDIDFSPDFAGRAAWVKFAGILTLTYNATTLILPGAANIVTAAGDSALIVSEGTDVVRILRYNRGNGSVIIPADGKTSIGGNDVITHSSGGNSVTLGVLGMGMSLNTGFGQLNLAGPSGAGATFQTTPYSPAQVTVNQNDYPIGTAFFVRLSTDASRNFTGFLGGGLGNALSEFRFFCNVGSFDAVLKHQDVLSAAANRLLNSTGLDITLTPNQMAFALYDGTTARWRIFKFN